VEPLPHAKVTNFALDMAPRPTTGLHMRLLVSPPPMFNVGFGLPGNSSIAKGLLGELAMLTHFQARDAQIGKHSVACPAVSVWEIIGPLLLSWLSECIVAASVSCHNPPTGYDSRAGQGNKPEQALSGDAKQISHPTCLCLFCCAFCILAFWVKSPSPLPQISRPSIRPLPFPTVSACSSRV
jgi:hypothetical protein